MSASSEFLKKIRERANFPELLPTNTDSPPAVEIRRENFFRTYGGVVHRWVFEDGYRVGTERGWER